MREREMGGRMCLTSEGPNKYEAGEATPFVDLLPVSIATGGGGTPRGGAERKDD